MCCAVACQNCKMEVGNHSEVTASEKKVFGSFAINVHWNLLLQVSELSAVRD